MITGAFGTTVDLRTGGSRMWYCGRDGVKRWADNHEPVPREDEEADAIREEKENTDE